MRKFVVLMLVGAMVGLGAAPARAGEVDILVQKLVDKGVLTPTEAQIVLHETKLDVEKQIARADHNTLPEWLQRIQLKGDLRLRYQYTQTKGSVARNRGRVRLRYGAYGKVNDKVNFGLRLATGTTGTSADAVRSTNQTFTDTFSKKAINLDEAWITFAPYRWLSATGGKMVNPAWEPGDLMWDTDITPEGGALQLNGSFKGLNWFMNSGVFILDEVDASTDDPFMYFFQPGIETKLTDNASLKCALAYYGYVNVKGTTLDGDVSPNTNTLTGGVLKYNYDALMPTFELGINEPLKAVGIDELPFGIKIPYLSLFGEYVNCFEPRDANQGYLMGIKFGDKKVGGAGQWQFKYMFRKLERDAVPDSFPDSDAYGGRTGIKGHEWVFEYGLGKNVTLGLDIYHSFLISANEVPETLVQADCVFKF